MTYFKMEMVPCGASTPPDGRDRFPLAYILVNLYQALVDYGHTR